MPTKKKEKTKEVTKSDEKNKSEKEIENIDSDSEKDESPEEKKKTERRIEKELLKIVVFLGVLVLVFMVSTAFFKSFNSFEYQGLTFTKERIGEIPVYHYYYYYDNNGNTVKYNLFVRTDPREIEIPLEGQEIVFNRGKRVYLAIESEKFEECKNSIIAVADLSRFLVDNQFDVRPGTPDFWESGRTGQEHVTCENRPKNVIITIKKGDQTMLDINGRCHNIIVNNCEILEATDAYKIQSIIDSKEYDSDRRTLKPKM